MNKYTYERGLTTQWIDMLTWRNAPEVRICANLRFKLLCDTATELRKGIFELKRLIATIKARLEHERLLPEEVLYQQRRLRNALTDLEGLKADLKDVMRNLKT
jgi:hypothetical protein